MVTALYSPRSLSAAIAQLKAREGGSAPERLLVLAESCFHVGAWNQAKGYVELLERFQRFHIHARILRARILLREGATDEAEALLDQLAIERGGAAIPIDLAPGIVQRLVAREGRAAALRFLEGVSGVGSNELLHLRIGLLAQMRRFESAAEIVTQAINRRPRQERAPLWIILGRLRALMKDYEGARVCFVSGMASEVDWKTAYRAARIAERGESWVAAARWSARALQGAPLNSAVTALCARLRIATGNFDGAILLLRDGLSRRYVTSHHYLLARALLASGKLDTACSTLQDFVDLHPSDWRARVLLARLLIRLDRRAEAIGEVEDLIEEYPGVPEVKELHEQMLMEFPGVDLGTALAITEDSQLPVAGFREEAADFALRDPHVREIFERPIPAMFQPCWSDESLNRRGTVKNGFLSMCKIVWALLVRETRTRFGESKLGYIWALVEPSLYIGVLVLVWLMMGAHYLYGLSITLFIITGFIPFAFFSTSYARITGLIHASSAMLAHPQIKPLDLVLARGLLEFATMLVIFALFLTGIALSGEHIRVANPLELVFCLVCLWMTGVGMALFFESTTRVAHWTRFVGSAISRKLFFSSGVFWAPQMLPGWVAKIFLFNPLLHLVELSRAQFTPLIWQHDLSLAYGAGFSVCVLLLGLMASISLREEVLAR